MLADAMRGTKGIASDLYRQPGKILEAIEKNTPKMIEQTIRMADASDCPVVIMPLHKGDDRFMSDKQFEKFYWPSFKRVLLAMIEEGLVPYPFAEGAFNRRLEAISDMPKTGVVLYFDQTDMKRAKETVGKVSCIAGNTPTSLLITGTAAQVKENCRKLIEDCAPGGGYILTGGAQIDKGNIENLKVMMEAAKEYGKY
jgi:uroporphyrinogen-III decarboxylase